MHYSVLLVSILITSVLAFPVASSKRQASSSQQLISFSLNDTKFDISDLQTFRVFYANTSAYLGAIKYQSYSEPLIASSFLSPEDTGEAGNSVSFLSIHASPTGFQQMYVVPLQSKPVGFSVPHGSAPAGVRTTGYSFGSDGTLLNNGLNLFYACRDQESQGIETWQIYWMAAASPNDKTCKGPIKIIADDACARY